MAKKGKTHKIKGKILNRRARFDYEILETVEAGMALTGPEVKSLRQGRGSLVDAFVQIRDGQAYLINMSIPRYEFSREDDYDPTHTRKLLLHKNQIHSFDQKVAGANLTLIPLEIYPQRGRFKVLVGLAKGRQQHDKRARLKSRDLDREIRQNLKEKVKYR